MSWTSSRLSLFLRFEETCEWYDKQLVVHTILNFWECAHSFFDRFRLYCAWGLVFSTKVGSKEHQNYKVEGMRSVFPNVCHIAFSSLNHTAKVSVWRVNLWFATEWSNEHVFVSLRTRIFTISHFLQRSFVPIYDSLSIMGICRLLLI